jgi:hypothetical protein
MTITLPCSSIAAIADRLAGRYAAGVESLGKMLVFAGLLVTIFGGVLWLGGGKDRGGLLPGDLSVERGNFKVYFPIVTCLVVSILLTVLVRLFRR